MSSDQYTCFGCKKYFHELDMYRIEGRFLCKQCACTGVEDIRMDTISLPERGYVPLPDKSHYRHTAIDPCQYVEAMGTAEFRGACVLNILKYLTRYPHKGTPLMDLAKAQDYLTMLIEHEKKKATSPEPPA